MHFGFDHWRYYTVNLYGSQFCKNDVIGYDLTNMNYGILNEVNIMSKIFIIIQNGKKLSAK